MAGRGGSRKVKVVLPASPKTPTIRTIPAPSGSSAMPFNLQEEQKRWVVIGICLNKILLPTLRNFLSPQMKTHYANLKAKHNIDKQTHGAHLSKEGKLRSLNYGSINNNEVNHKKKSILYDYNVKSEVELAKLYLQPFMAKFTGFDDTCDLSAVLGILASAGMFSVPIQNCSGDVRNDVRNEWGHCNFSNWDALKFSKCFQLMESLVRALSLAKPDEKKVTDELKDWETKGLQLCMGKPVDADLVKFIEVEVNKLDKTVKRLEKTQSDEAQRISNGLQSVRGSIEKFKTEINKSIERLKESQEITNERVHELSKETTSVVKSLKNNERILTSKVGDIENNQVELTKRVDEGDEKYARLSDALQAAIETRSAQQKLITFQAPNRIPCFHNRAVELEMLSKALEKKSTPCNLTAIYGLGGTGKTSLALEHIWRNKGAYNGGVFWISGEQRKKFELSIWEMAQQIGTFEDDFQRTLSKTISWLQLREEYWCLVVDNLDELELSSDMIKLLSGHWQRNVKGHILITTRREKQRLDEDFNSIFSDENCIGLKNLSVDESIQFMKAKTGISTTKDDDDVIRQLVSELGTLPLALDQAAAFIRNRKVSFSQYIDYYKECKLKIFQDPKAKARHPVPQDISMDRISIHTTWQMNFDYVCRMSEDYGIGQAAALVMEVAAFLSPDDIPQDVINVGLPPVENKDFSSCLSTSFGTTEIVDTLTSFSLFQKFTAKSFSVHRLVQEVIRSRISASHLKEVLHCACRMLCYAFAKTTSPNEVCTRFQGDTVFSQDDLPSLHLWGKLGLHASVLQNFVLQTCKEDDVSRHEVFYTEEFATLLSEASLYLSVCRQKVEAMELQKSKLEIMTHVEELTSEKLEYLNYFDIPLKNVEFKLISHCMASQEPVAGDVMASPKDIDKANDLREKGNAAVKDRNYDGAIDLYTKALASHNDSRLYSNRALCYLKLKKAELALQDCESCLKQEPRNSKALRRKAWALHDLLSKDEKLLGKTRAAAAFAAYVDPTAAKEKQFRDMFPDLLFEEVYNPLQLTSALFLADTGVTILLHGGSYELFGALIDKDIQLVALDKGVVVKLERSLTILHCSCYVEGIVFAENSGSISCIGKVGLLNLFKCKASGGFESCADFPDCNGGTGCVAADLAGHEPCDRTNKFGEPGISGVCGSPCICINFGATGLIEDCEISRCGGGGILCQGKNSTVSVISCRVHSNRQAGLEARGGGCLISENNDIYGNKYHGILIGPDAGKCHLISNEIFENHKEGVLVYKTMDHQVAIISNRIYHNNAFGISLDSCQVEIKENKIFENYFHGIHAKTLTTAIIENNDIYSNKCGGIHIGINFSARIVIKSNIIRDNSGSWIVHGDSSISLPGSFASETRNNQDWCGLFYLPEGETKIYTLPPIFENNDDRNNDPKVFHPKEKIQSVQSVCAFCHSSQNLKRCLKCNTAMYCSSDCQERHWKKHRGLCSALKDQYSVTVELLDIILAFNSSDSDRSKESDMFVRTFGPHLQTVRTGPKPNPKSNRKFIVKIQTRTLNTHPLQNLTVYDKSTSIDNVIHSPEIFHVIMECGVVGQMSNFTSKKAFFYATFAIPNNRKKLNIYLNELAPYQEW